MTNNTVQIQWGLSDLMEEYNILRKNLPKSIEAPSDNEPTIQNKFIELGDGATKDRLIRNLEKLNKEFMGTGEQ